MNKDGVIIVCCLIMLVMFITSMFLEAPPNTLRRVDGTVVSISTHQGNHYVWVKVGDGQVHKVKTTQQIQEAVLIGGHWSSGIAGE